MACVDSFSVCGTLQTPLCTDPSSSIPKVLILGNGKDQRFRAAISYVKVYWCKQKYSMLKSLKVHSSNYFLATPRVDDSVSNCLITGQWCSTRTGCRNVCISSTRCRTGYEGVNSRWRNSLLSLSLHFYLIYRLFFLLFVIQVSSHCCFIQFSWFASSIFSLLLILLSLFCTII